jgi:uncharacterized protein YuzE
MKIDGHYDPNADIAWLRLEDYEPSTVVAEEDETGVREIEPATGRIVGQEYWNASGALPEEVLAMLSPPIIATAIRPTPPTGIRFRHSRPTECLCRQGSPVIRGQCVGRQPRNLAANQPLPPSQTSLIAPRRSGVRVPPAPFRPAFTHRTERSERALSAKADLCRRGRCFQGPLSRNQSKESRTPDTSSPRGAVLNAKSYMQV